MEQAVPARKPAQGAATLKRRRLRPPSPSPSASSPSRHAAEEGQLPVDSSEVQEQALPAPPTSPIADGPSAGGGRQRRATGSMAEAANAASVAAALLGSRGKGRPAGTAVGWQQVDESWAAGAEGRGTEQAWQWLRVQEVEWQLAGAAETPAAGGLRSAALEGAPPPSAQAPMPPAVAGTRAQPVSGSPAAAQLPGHARVTAATVQAAFRRLLRQKVCGLCSRCREPIIVHC